MQLYMSSLYNTLSSYLEQLFNFNFCFVLFWGGTLGNAQVLLLASPVVLGGAISGARDQPQVGRVQGKRLRHYTVAGSRNSIFSTLDSMEAKLPDSSLFAH